MNPLDSVLSIEAPTDANWLALLAGNRRTFGEIAPRYHQGRTGRELLFPEERHDKKLLAKFLAWCCFFSMSRPSGGKDSLINAHLSRRQRQILEALYELGEASAEDIRARMPAAPSNSAVRATLKIMEDRGAVVRQEKGLHYVYRPSQPRESAQTSELHRLVYTFFNNSVEHAVVALLGANRERLSNQELDRIRALIDRAKKKE